MFGGGIKGGREQYLHSMREFEYTMSGTLMTKEQNTTHAWSAFETILIFGSAPEYWRGDGKDRAGVGCSSARVRGSAFRDRDTSIDE